MRAEANTLREMGYHLVPILPLGKAPFLPWKGLQTTRREIDRWLEMEPRMNLAIHTGRSGVVAVDADDEEALGVLRREYPPSPFSQRTPRGGEHRLYRAEFEVPPAVRLRGLKLDVRAGASLLMMAPSRSPSGKWELIGEVVRPSELPPISPSLVLRPKTVSQPVVERGGPSLQRALRYAEIADPAVSGQNGHGRTFWLACRLLKVFPLLTRDELLVCLRAFNTRCRPPWSEAELRHKVASAWAEVR